ncbi:MAG: amino acid decarboxylase [Eubacterium sp.]|nr:amino acid decarboxylase [Eubacterium sp.]
MKLPISEFLERYDSDKDIIRLHMPGHKGSFDDCSDDITEVYGADSLYEADGIIYESEKMTSQLFGTRRTFYSTEGSSQVIKSMCYLAIKHASEVTGDYSRGDYTIAASRNAHKSFINASMLLQFDIAWLPSEDEDYSICKCSVTPDGLRKFLTEYKKNNKDKTLAAVFVTSPDYLGNMLDVKGLAEVAHEFSTLLICDNAHGSYLKFVGGDMHPISLGADMTTDSAHKTLPVLTGGAYLHISKNSPEGLENQARQALLLFGSTSPSYKILKSMDKALERVKPDDYVECARHLEKLRKDLNSIGIKTYGKEPLKLTLDLRDSFIDGNHLKSELRERKIICEYGEPDFVVTMWSPFNRYPEDCERFLKAVSEVKESVMASSESSDKRDNDGFRKKRFNLPEVVYQPYETIFMQKKIVKVNDALVGEIAADNLTGCPPAITPVIAGERIDKDIIEIMNFYGVEEIGIIK